MGNTTVLNTANLVSLATLAAETGYSEVDLWRRANSADINVFFGLEGEYLSHNGATRLKAVLSRSLSVVE